MPGLRSNPFTMYSGFVEIDQGKNLFYWFVESLNNPSTDPVVLWLNGGPGCSSLGGFLAEHGPFAPDQNGNLVLNPYTWARVANVLYLEAPAGVGYSYWSGQATFTDMITAQDNHEFLAKWFALFPQFAQNDLYISGESYAGHYIPTLVNQIYNKTSTQPNVPPQSNFKGFLVGNPSTKLGYDKADSLITYYQTHGMIPMRSLATPAGNFDPYDILSDVCESSMLKNYIRFPNHMNVIDSKQVRNVPNRPECIGTYVHNYLNRADVQVALGIISSSATNSTFAWNQCNDIDYTYGPEPMMPLYITFMNNTDYKILVFSGDQDTVINFIGTEEWIYNTGRPIVNDWAPWYYSRDGSDSNRQIGGWMVRFDRITFMTVKGAGHMVPWSQPAPALEMFRNFLFKF
jgi:carboxypeptidase C (cathepsin A)